MVFFMSILQTTELKKYYGAKPNITKALDGVNLSVEQGEFVAIVGTSGSGKSTLLNMIGGLDVPTSGKVIVDGRDLSTLKDEQLTIFRRRKIGFIFQNYNLVPVLNVYENIVLPVELDGNKIDKKFMKEVVQILGLEDKLNNMPNNLSGGQQQRVASAVWDKDEKACIVKIANTSDKAQPVSVTFNGLKKSDKLVEGKCITLQSADLDKDNTVEHPNVITPKESDVTIEGNVLNVEMAPKTFVLYKFVKASNK